MSNHPKYEFHLSPEYQKVINKQKAILQYLVMPAVLVFLFLIMQTALTEVPYYQAILTFICIFSAAFFYGLIHWGFNDIRLIIDESGISTNKALYNLSMKQHYRWKKIVAVIEVSLTEPVFINGFLGLRVKNLPDETIYIPTHVKSMPVPLAFSDKAWVNPNISLGDAIKTLSQKDIIETTAADYRANHAAFGSQVALGKKVEVVTISSLFVFLLAGVLLFLDTRFTLNFGQIKQYMVYLGICLTIVVFLVLFFLEKTKKPEKLLGYTLASALFGSSLASLTYTSLNMIHNDLAKMEVVSFTLKKANRGKREYDLWESEYGHIDCKKSDVSEGSEFELNVSKFMTVRRYQMSDICLADERSGEEK